MGRTRSIQKWTNWMLWRKQWRDGCGIRDFAPLRTAEEELRISMHCGLRRRNFGFRCTADCGGGTLDFDALRTAEEELWISTHFKETVQQETLTSVRYPQASTPLAAHVCIHNTEFLIRSPQRVEVRSSSSAVRNGSNSEVPPPQSAVRRNPKFLFRSPQRVESPHSPLL
jgi:hypothetical protein